MATYYMPDDDTSKLQQLITWARTKKRPRPSFPRAIQIQTNSRCNAACLFCGYTETHSCQEHGSMDDGLFRKIVDECGRHHIGRISPYLMNEPLLDKNLPEKIRYINQVKKWTTKTKINTNGALLTPEMSEGLIDAGLRHLWVSVQGYSADTYKQSMGLNLDKTLANIDEFLAIRARKGKKLPKLSITTIRTSLVDPELEYARKYWGERDVVFKVHNLDNRSGKDLGDVSVGTFRRKMNCDLFLKQAYVLFNGDMILCCHDWRRTVVLGNLNESSIEDIWNSENFISLIRQYNAGDLSNLDVCRKCFIS
jgi:radical SAM protein with 4Fe4S-binding SPASM domain